MNSKAILATAVACLCVSSGQSASADDLIYEWYTVANNGDVIPTDSSSNCGSCHEDMVSSGSAMSTSPKVFNSYNQPAINKNGAVVFRARSRGGMGGGESGGMSGSGGEPERGIYMRNLAEQGPLYMVFRRGGTVPQPNNTTIRNTDQLASFNEFPSVPRIDAGSDTIATRGQSTPLWTYMLEDGSETRTGTSGVYTSSGHGMPTTGASMLGDVFELGAQVFPYFQVPVHGAVPAGTGFDQFPGSPAVTERTTIVFKGNFAVAGVGKTGVFYRDFAAKGGVAPIDLIASSFTNIPGCTPITSPACLFGSTAPPSAGGKYAVFAGYDNEQAPTLGGIYRARLGNKPIVLETVVKIGDPVPETDATFDRFGEAISVSSNGRHVLFWGGWGGTIGVPLICPDEGSEPMRKACDDATNDAAEVGEDTMGQVPRYQGFFLRDMQSGATTVIARTGDMIDGRPIEDFVYWNFSGRVPGKGHEGGEEDGEETEEMARWRSTSFGAVSGTGAPGMSVIKARFEDNKDGIENEHALLLRDVKPSGLGELVSLLRTGDLGAMVDPEAPTGAVISALGIERDGFRGNWLAINVSMLVPSAEVTAAADGGESEEETGWAGIYAAHFLDDEPLAP
jgi:hypothetical protein